MPICPKCGENKDYEHFAMRVDRGKIGRRIVCRECQNEYFRTLKRRKGVNDKLHLAAWNQKYPEKKLTHRRIYWGKKTGKVQKHCCVICGSPASQAHHPDYTKPLLVAWLCPKHHGAVHSGRLFLLPWAFCDYTNVHPTA